MANSSNITHCSLASQPAVGKGVAAHNATTRSSSPSVIPLPFFKGSVEAHQNTSVNSISNNKDLDINTLNFECNVPENALAYIDDFLNGDFAVAHDEEFRCNPSLDPFTVISCSHNIDLLTSTSLSSFGLDQLNLLFEENHSSLHSVEVCGQQRKSPHEIDHDLHGSNAEQLSASTAQIVENGELVPCLVNARVADCHSSNERRVGSWPCVLHQNSHLCEHCEVLRQIIHTNGAQVTKLEIHGSEGQSYHAVMQTRFWINNGCPSTFEQQVVEFPVGNSDYVKQFLLQYSLLRRKEGFMLQQDTLLPIINTGFQMVPDDYLMTALNAMENRQGLHLNIPTDPPPMNYTEEKPELFYCGLTDPDDYVKNDYDLLTKPIRSSAAAQREKTGKLRMSDLAKHFHLPINAAAKELGICPTVLKKICRRNGMQRWPHRKVFHGTCDCKTNQYRSRFQG